MNNYRNQQAKENRPDDFQNDPFVVDWSCVNSKKEGL